MKVKVIISTDIQHVLSFPFQSERIFRVDNKLFSMEEETEIEEAIEGKINISNLAI